MYHPASMTTLAIHVFTILLCCCTLSHASDPILAIFSPEVSGLKMVQSWQGIMGFRILRRDTNTVLIGGKEILVAVNYINAQDPLIETEAFQTCDSGNAFFQCRDQSTFKEDRDCRNFIRIAEELSGNQLFVCGTNALNPRCYVCNMTKTDMGIKGISCPGPQASPCVVSTTEGHGTLDGSNIAPKHWELNTTSLYKDGKLFLGVAKRNDKTVISRFDVNIAGPDGSETAFTRPLETSSYLSRSVKEANFVGKPLVVGDRAYYFYREIAVEHISEGNMVYSRVARVCKDDTGISNYWSSFQKARLNCSIPGAFPSYYNEIQDVVVQQNGSEYYIHTVFASLRNGPQGSAVCVFRLSDIDAIFNTGRFRGPSSLESIWLTRPNSDVPVPRPGLDCAQQSRILTFIQQFPLMQQLAENHNEYDPITGQSDAPVFSVDDVRFTALVVDNTPVGNIYYVATETGSILKAYHDGEKFRVYKFLVTDNKQPLVGLHLSGGDSNRHLVAVSDNAVYNLPLQDCATSCEQKCSELLRGYCEWQQDDCCANIRTKECAANPSDVHLNLSSEGSVTACEDERIQLYCHVQTGPLCPPVTLRWTRDGGLPVDKLGHLITLDPLYEHANNKLSLMTAHAVLAHNTTEIECTGTMETGMETKQTVTKAAQIELKNCVTAASLQKRYKRHNQMKEENRKSKLCKPNVFDCDKCPQPYLGRHTEL